MKSTKFHNSSNEFCITVPVSPYRRMTRNRLHIWDNFDDLFRILWAWWLIEDVNYLSFITGSDIHPHLIKNNARPNYAVYPIKRALKGFIARKHHIRFSFFSFFQNGYQKKKKKKKKLRKLKYCFCWYLVAPSFPRPWQINTLSFVQLQYSLCQWCITLAGHTTSTGASARGFLCGSELLFEDIVGEKKLDGVAGAPFLIAQTNAIVCTVFPRPISSQSKAPFFSTNIEYKKRTPSRWYSWSRALMRAGTSTIGT